MGTVALTLVLLPAAGWLVAFFIVFQHYSAVRQTALEVFTREHQPARVSAPPVSREAEARLRQVHRENVIIFNSYVPFVGTGHTLDTWKLTLYTNPGRPGLGARGQGTRGVFVSPEEVHEYLLSEIPRVLPRVVAERRLYVDGGMAKTVPHLIPHSPGETVAIRPRAIVDDDVLDQYTREPTRTARTYCCFVENSGNGDVVVTVLVRAEMIGDTVYVEGHSQVLLPLQTGFKDIVWVSQNADQATLPVARTAAPMTMGLWLESPLRLAKNWLGDQADARALRDEGRLIARGQPVNYGASSSLREDVMLPADPGYFGAADEVMYFRVITQQVLNSLYDLLTSKHIASPDFDEQRELIMEQTFPVGGVGKRR